MMIYEEFQARFNGTKRLIKVMARIVHTKRMDKASLTGRLFHSNTPKNRNTSNNSALNHKIQKNNKTKSKWHNFPKTSSKLSVQTIIKNTLKTSVYLNRIH